MCHTCAMQVSVNKVVLIPVTQSEDCQLGAEVLSETSSLEHKFKLISAVVSAQRKAHVQQVRQLLDEGDSWVQRPG